MTLRLRDAGDCALVAEYGDRIDDVLADRVLALDAALAAHPVAGVLETVPTYRSLLVHYDPLTITRSALAALVQNLAGQPVTVRPGATWTLPACYDASLATDLALVADACRLTPDAVVRLHATATYRVVMCGFSPGWAYLSGLPPALTLPRRASPRDLIPAGSLIIAGGQAIVAAGAMPSGWHILGQTPERLFAPQREPVFLLAPGDMVRLEQVDSATFAALSLRARTGEVLARKAPP